MTFKDAGGNRAQGGGYLELLVGLQPGDVIDVWMENAYVVKTVFQCSEVLNGYKTEWRWMFLDDGSLVEVSPDGYFRYREHRMCHQGTSLYEELVAQDGALVRFEERVRAGTSGRRPVHVTIDGKEYRVTSTGSLAARRLGEEPGLLPWKALNDDPDKNTYFGMVDSEREEDVVLGLWTSHVCLSFGGPLEASQISGVYQRGKP